MSKATTTDDDLVAMACIGVSQSRGVLRTLLGSCIGVVLYERKRKILGLAHVVMPDSLGRVEPVGKYADTAVPETIRRMQLLAGSGQLSLTAKIAGGANMFANLSVGISKPVGDQNIAAVERILSMYKIPIVGRDLGGTVGRRIVANIETGEVEVFFIGKSSLTI